MDDVFYFDLYKQTVTQFFPDLDAFHQPYLELLYLITIG